MQAWSVATATTTGESHIIREKGSDDAIVTRTCGKWTAIVACDGAGSSVRSSEGANFVASNFTEQLLEISVEIDQSGPGPWLNDQLIHRILTIREELAKIAGSYELQDFHCTLVAVLVSDTGGLSVHIGDGAIIIGRRSGEDKLDISIHSEPENGEYANETFFITENTWIKNIRIKPLGPCDWVIVMTDGAASVLLTKTIKYEILAGLLGVISDEKYPEGIQETLSEAVNDDYARSCSNDDRSIGLAFKSHDVFKEYVNTCLERNKLISKIETTSCDKSTFSQTSLGESSSFFMLNDAKLSFFGLKFRAITLALVICSAMVFMMSSVGGYYFMFQAQSCVSDLHPPSQLNNIIHTGPR